MSTSISTRNFGKTSDKVGSIGFGAMGMAAFYGEPVDQTTVDSLLSECLSQGVTMIDTADIYSPLKSQKLGYNEQQIGKFLASNPDARKKMFLCTKFVNRFDGKGGLEQRGDRDYCHSACEDSLKRLGVDQIDLYYAHRAAPNADVTETVGALQELKDAGKIRYLGVSEYNLDQLERANKVAHIDALQIEVSPWTPDVIKNGTLEWCEKNGTALIAYSPLGRGFLTGQYKSADDFEEGDFRRNNPRFQGENFDKNLELVNDIKKIADKKGATPGQIALAWVMAKSPSIIPIPGTKKSKYLAENIGADKVRLNDAELKEIDGVIDSFKVSGSRYPEQMSKTLAF
jgi:aryl-alcohol dehydrogenase-like predicted oxidoreductase